MAAISNSRTRRGSPRAGPSVSRDNIQNGGVTAENPEQDLEGDSGNGAVNPWRICPTSEDEPTIICRLSGNSMSGFTEICGWSMQSPLKFDNIHSSTKFKAMSYSGGNIVEAAEELTKKCIKLAEMKELIGCPGQVNCPVYVQVVAKRKASILLCSNKLLVIPLVVVADDSGYCVVCSFNEGLETVYKSVDVGDHLLLTSCIPQQCRKAYHKGLFSENMFLDLELKVQYHSVRNHYLRKFTARRLPDFKFPAALFDASCRLKVPSDLEKEFQNTEKPPWITPPDAECYYDLIGVISYVSRIERFKEPDNQCDVECLVNNEIKLEPFKTYVTFRWIKLVDKNSKPFPVKLFNLALDCQDLLVPGSIIIISHCQTKKTDYSNPYSSTSQFSEIYSGAELETYYMLHPSSFFTEGPKELFARATYVKIMSRTDCHWSIGGMPTIKIHKGFREWYYKNDNPNDLEFRNLARRESRRSYFKGLILRAFIVQQEDCPSIYYVHQRFKELKQLKSTNYNLSEHHLPYNMFNNVSWYSFMRKLPPINPQVFQFPKCKEIMKEIVKSFESYCGPLLMPAKINDQNLPLMAGLERVDGLPYFLLDIFDETKCHWYRCIWKSCDYTINEMAEKVNLAKQKQILCLAENFCVEKHATLEVTLHDFVIDDVE